MICTKCGSDNKANAQFCKNCGTNIIDNENIISRINGKINLFTFFIGLIISFVILFIGALLFGEVLTSGFNLSIYVGMVLLTMAFFGSFLTGISCGEDLNEGYINGAFLSLFIIVITGFVLGILMFVYIGITASIASALSSFSSIAFTIGYVFYKFSL